VIEFSGALGLLIITLTLGALLLSGRRQLRNARAAGATLDTVPLTWFCWPPDHEPDRDANRPASYSAFIAGLIPEDAAKLEAARAALQGQGTAFSITVAVHSGGAYTIEGRKTEAGATVLWLLDTSAVAKAEEACQEATGLRQMLDAIPVPVWRRDADLVLVSCNRAYAEAIETTPEFAVNEGRELADGIRAGERRHVVIGGSRRLIEFGEVDHAEGKIGFALDRTIWRPRKPSCGAT
jgi:PAS domain-containing protein